MNIGIDVSLLSNEWDGIGTYILSELKYIANENTNDIFYLYSNKPVIIDLNISRNFIVREDNTNGHLKWLLTKLKKHLIEDKIDVFWQPNFLLPYRIKGMKLIVTVHDLSGYAYMEFASMKNNIAHRLFLKRTCKCADRILAISKSCMEDIEKYLRIPSHKIKVIYNGMKMFNEEFVKAINFEEVISKYELLKKEYLLFVGTLSPRKNDKVMVDAYIKYRDNGGKRKLVLAGGIAKNSTDTVKFIKRCKYANDIILTGYIDEKTKIALYYCAKLVLYPSRLEGFGLPLLEAMQAEVPVITSKVSCMPEIAMDAAIYLNNIDDSSELAKRIFEVENMDYSEERRLIENGKRRVAYFDSLDYRKKTLEEIRKICLY